MNRDLKSFTIRSDGKILDYRVGERLSLDDIRIFFQKKSYEIKKIWNGNRHVLGILKKNNEVYFLKLSTSEGISIVTQNEYNWNNYFNKYFPKDLPYKVPKNYRCGFYRDKYFYLITDYFIGKLLCNVVNISNKSNYLIQYITQIIELSEKIQKMPLIDFAGQESKDYKKRFIDKVNNWFNDIPSGIRRKYRIKYLLSIIENGVNDLSKKPRHGDFTPWHLIKLRNFGLGLIDGEHALSGGMENYDICYFIQRVFSVLKNPQVAKDIHSSLLSIGYKADRLRVVLSARAIGGFLDESLDNTGDYCFADNFAEWVKNT